MIAMIQSKLRQQKDGTIDTTDTKEEELKENSSCAKQRSKEHSNEKVEDQSSNTLSTNDLSTNTFEASIDLIKAFQRQKKFMKQMVYLFDPIIKKSDDESDLNNCLKMCLKRYYLFLNLKKKRTK